MKMKVLVIAVLVVVSAAGLWYQQRVSPTPEDVPSALRMGAIDPCNNGDHWLVESITRDRLTGILFAKEDESTTLFAPFGAPKSAALITDDEKVIAKRATQLRAWLPTVEDTCVRDEFEAWILYAEQRAAEPDVVITNAVVFKADDSHVQARVPTPPAIQE